jgi:hypothetical protein
MLKEKLVLQFAAETSEMTNSGVFLVFRPNIDAIKQQVELTRDNWVVKLGFLQ